MQSEIFGRGGRVWYSYLLKVPPSTSNTTKIFNIEFKVYLPDREASWRRIIVFLITAQCQINHYWPSLTTPTSSTHSISLHLIGGVPNHYWRVTRGFPVWSRQVMGRSWRMCVCVCVRERERESVKYGNMCIQCT